MRRPCTIAILATTLVLLAGCASFGEGRRVAQEASGCTALDAVTPVPLRYVNEQSSSLYRGCGKYVLVRCAISTSTTACQALEVMDVEKANASATTFPDPP